MKKLSNVLGVIFIICAILYMKENIVLSASLLTSAIMLLIAGGIMQRQENIVDAINKASDPYEFFANKFAIKLGINNLNKLVREGVKIIEHKDVKLDVTLDENGNYKIAFNVDFRTKDRIDNIRYSFITTCEKSPQNFSNWSVIASDAKIKEEFLK